MITAEKNIFSIKIFIYLRIITYRPTEQVNYRADAYWSVKLQLSISDNSQEIHISTVEFQLIPLRMSMADRPTDQYGKGGIIH